MSYFFSKEGSTCAACDADSDNFANVVIAFVEDNHLILLCTTTELFVRTLTVVFYEDVKLFSYISSI